MVLLVFRQISDKQILLGIFQYGIFSKNSSIFITKKGVITLKPNIY